MHRCISWDSLPEEAQDQQGYILSEDYNVFDGIVQWGRRMFTSPHDEVIWVNSCVVGTWLGWKPLATAIKPQEFDLPLADGIIALQPCIYWKNQFEEVTIYGCTYGEVTEGDTIATLPEGFRPDHPVEWPASFTGDAGRVSGTVFISESGIVSIHTPAPAMSVVFAASFLTAS